MFVMHKISFTIAGITYSVPETDLSDEQVRHMVAQAVYVKLQRASAGVDDDREKAHAKRLKRIETIYEIDGAGPRRSPHEVELVNLFRTWLRDKGEKTAALNKATSVEKCQEMARVYLPPTTMKGDTTTRVDNLTRILSDKAHEIVKSRASIEAEV